jgi:hypothetical protein
MRRASALAVAFAIALGIGTIAATRSATLAQDAPTGQERFVVFEMFGRET